MIEKTFLKLEENFSFIKLFLTLLSTSLIISFFVSFFARSSIFIIAFLSLMLANPVSKYLFEEDEKIISTKYSYTNLFEKYEKEIFIFWTIFISGIILFLILLYFNFEFSYQEKVYKIFNAGMFVSLNSNFSNILLNNLGIMLLTLTLTSLINSAIVFILYWNASVISYFLYNSKTLIQTSILILPHVLLESAGYILAGIAGTLISYKLGNLKKKNFFYKDFLFIISLSIFFIILGASIETI